MPIQRFSAFHAFTFVLLTIFSIVGCQSRPEILLHEVDIPIVLSDSRLRASDLSNVIDQTASKIDDRLSQATLTDLVVWGNCDAFPEIEGKITLVFMQVKRGLFGVLYYEALASINTAKHTMDIRILSDPYLNYAIQDYKEAEMNAVLQNIALYIKENNITDCTVELAKIQDSWNVICSKGEGENWEQICHFTIDATSGKSGR